MLAMVVFVVAVNIDWQSVVSERKCEQLSDRGFEFTYRYRGFGNR